MLFKNQLKNYLKLMNLPPHLRRIMSVQGALTQNEVELLFELASKVSEGCIIEVGSYRGRSTVALALGTQGGSQLPVYAIEPHETFTGLLGGRFGPWDRVEFFKNMLRTQCAETVRLVNVSSEVISKGWHQPISLLWIDGDHSYEGTRRDFDCWAKFVIPTGLIAFHDSLDENLGPKKVIDEVLSSQEYQKLSQVDLITVLEKNNV
jgi:hypothetical protein